jgi:copper homeostasis protein
MPILEIATFNFPSCLIAAKAGAHRIEVCENQQVGGVTPSYGYLKQVRKLIPDIPLFVMVRPRGGGNFVYTPEEVELMLQDVALVKSLNFEGIVTGALLPNDEIDKNTCYKIAELAYPLELSFHKAFDRIEDKLQALQQLQNLGFSRVLTSGHVGAAAAATDTLKSLVDAQLLEIVVGGGVRSQNIQQLVLATGANEFHSAAVLNKATDSLVDEAEVKALLAGLGR